MDLITYALAKKLTEFPVTNSIKNGDFSQGTQNWVPMYGTLSAENNIATYTVTQKYASARIEQSVVPKEAHEYYVRGEIKPKHATECAISFGGSLNMVARETVPIVDMWNVLSGKGVFTSEHFLRFYHSTAFSQHEIGDQFQFRNILLMDITEAFGAGNEPTKEEIDELLSYFPESWFDGKQNLPGKWVMTYLLNQVRDIKTAVVGLGGTV